MTDTKRPERNFDFSAFPLTEQEKRGYTQEDIDALSQLSKQVLRIFNTHPQREELRPHTIKEAKEYAIQFKAREEREWKNFKAQEERNRLENERLDAYAAREKTPEEIAERERSDKEFNRILFAAMESPCEDDGGNF